MFGSNKPRIVSIVRPPSEDSGHTNPAPVEFEPVPDPDDNKYKKETRRLPGWSALVVLVFLLSIFTLVWAMDSRLPRPLTVSDLTSNPEAFIEERARRSLQSLTSIGARPAGSYENEVLAVELLKRELQSIQRRADSSHRLTIDVQKPRGSFNLEFLDGLTHSYRNVQNVIAKLESGTGAKHSLLVNCHFDSVPQSPGASDDAVSCAIMLEVLEVLATSPQPLRHNVIFLFNGAEENMLPASHGFITQHVWAEDIRAFINLESCGSGGKEFLFQSGPGHSWLIDIYAQVAPHPFASVIGQEIFQSGIIPADTDYVIFRDYGKIPGLDIAYMKNGYIYHTKYDSEERIQPGSIQRSGDNILALVRHIAQSEVLADSTAHSHSHGGVVFFDFLGLIFIHYSEMVGIIINVTTVLASVWLTLDKILHSYNYGVSRSVYIRQLGYTLMMQVCGCVASFIVVTLIATLMDTFSRPMSWYSRPWLILPLYMGPTVMSVIAVFYFVLGRQKKYFQFVDGVWIIESLYFEVSKLIWCGITLTMTVLRLKSSFFPMVWVLFPTIGRLVLDKIYDLSPAKRKSKDLKWLLIHLSSLLVPLIMQMYFILITFTMFIPLMGRSGPAVNPDLIIGLKAATVTLATISFLSPLAMVINKPMKLVTILYVTTMLTMGVCFFTRLGFPYSATPSNLAPHRGLVIHTERHFYDRKGAVQNQDSGYFVVNLDRNSPKVLQDWVPELRDARDIKEKECEAQLYCGVPVYYPASTLLRHNNWIPAPPPKLWTPISLNITHQEAPTIGTRKLLFKAVGPDHMGVFISPAVGIQLKSWSLAGGELLPGPPWKMGRPTYYIFVSSGKQSDTTEFWLELEVPRSHYDGNELLDMALVGHYIHGAHMKSSQFSEFLSQFPGWSYPVGWTAAYKSYKF